MRTSLFLLALTVVLGCESKRVDTRSPQAPRDVATVERDAAAIAHTVTSRQQRTKMPPLDITWRLTRVAGDKTLQLDYTVTNTGDELVYLVDELVEMDDVGLRVITDRAVVMQGADSDTVRLVAGHVGPGPGQAVAAEPVPPARTLAPKASLSGSKRIPLPLTSWHPYMGKPALSKVPSRAVFEVTWLPATPPGNHPAWQNRRASGGGVIRIPSEVFVSLSLRRTVTQPLKLP